MQGVCSLKTRLTAKIQYFLLLFIPLLLVSPGRASAASVRVGLFYDGASKSPARIAQAQVSNVGTLQVTALAGEALEVPVTYGSVSLSTNCGPCVQIGAFQKVEAALEAARQARNDYAYRSYVVLTRDTTGFPYKVWVEGAEPLVRIQYPGAFDVAAGGDVVVAGDSTGIEPGIIAVDKFRLLFRSPQEVPTKVSPAGQASRLYEGAVEVSAVGGRLVFINELDLEKYVVGVVPNEMPESWPLEALKAQAIAARSYALAHLKKHGVNGFDLCDSSLCCQKYGGYDSTCTQSARAVSETAGIVARYNQKIAVLFYHSNSGGHTEDSENVWTEQVPYLRGVPDPFSVSESLIGHLASRNKDNSAFPAQWVKSYTRAELEAMLAAKNINVGTLLEIRSVSRSASGRQLEVLVRGTLGEARLKKTETRTVFNLDSNLYDIIQVSSQAHVLGAGGVTAQVNPGSAHVLSAGGKTAPAGLSSYVLRGASASRTVSAQSTGVSFVGKGWGHGVGMSQWGAFEMARSGYTYEDILKYYFQGIVLEPF